MAEAGTQSLFNLLRRKLTAVSIKRPNHGARNNSRAAGFKINNVSRFIGDNLIARLTMNRKGDLITHRAGRDKKRSLFTEQIGDPFTKSICCRIFPGLLVASIRGHHHLKHGFGGTGFGITE
jgi:hypothetical protein